MVIECLWCTTSFAENCRTVVDENEYGSKPCRAWGIEEITVTHKFRSRSTADKRRDKTQCREK